MPSYALSPHVWSCLDGDALIFLDLKRDRYVGARACDVAGLLDSVAGLPPRLSGVAAGDEARTAATRARLLEEGLLMVSNGEVVRRAEFAGPVRSVLPEAAAGADWKNVIDFTWACAFAGLMLKRRRLDLAMKALAARKARARNMLDQAAIERRVASFLGWRPWFPARRVCLFDSIALMHFLGARGHAAELVIGVRARPFGAHCWVQHEEAVLNDRIDNCRSYVPIFRV